MVESVVQSRAEIVVDSTEKKLIRVLHVDDELGLLKVAKQCLELQGPFQVDTACSVEEALIKLKEKEYDAVVSDYKMPGKDGLEFLKELRAKGNDIPFILFTGKGREEVIIKALNLGADHYVNKNGDPEAVYTELKHLISEIVGTRKAKSELQESQMRYRNLIENAPDVVYTISENGTLASLNPAFERLTDWKRSEWIGKSFASLVHPDDLNTAMETFEKALHGECLPPYELRVLSKSGEYLVGEFTSRPWSEKGKIVGELGIVRDVTEPKKTEETLRKSEEKYRQLVENLHEGIWAIDKDAYTTFVNPRMADMLGYTIDEMKGKHLFSFMDERGVELAKHLLKRRQQGIKEQHDFEFIRKDGMRIYATLETTPLSDENGNYIGALTSVMDTTERRKMENTLRESEEKHRVISSITADFVFSCLKVGEGSFAIDWMAGATEKVFGYSTQEIEDKGCWRFLVHPQDLPTFEEKVTGLRPGQSGVCELRINRKDGSTRWIKVSSQATEGKINPTNLRLFGACEDITERKKTEELLGESEGRFRGLFESIQDPVGIFVGRGGRLIDYNAAFKKSSGYTDEELKGKVFLDFVHPGDHALVLEKYQTEYSEDEYPLIYEIRGMNKKGECIPLELSVSTYRKKGKVIGIEVIHRDLTERKKVEMSLKESQERFERLFQGNPEAAAYLDPDYRIQDVNPRFEELFGYSLEQIRGKHINDVVVPDCRRGEGEALDRDARKGYVYRNTVRRKKDGSLVPVSVSAAPITNESGVTGIVAMYNDISELRNAEKKLETMNEKLRVVGGLTRHDVRNKLSAITGNIYLNRKKLLDHPDVLEGFSDMQSACEQIVRIFEFAKDYERLGVEELALVDVKTTVDKAASSFSGLKGVRIVNECHGLTILADSLLERLFYNLIDNSLKYGDKLTQIRISYEKSENQLKLVYEDDGVGISQDAKAKLFDEGFTTGKGSGYGLYLIKRIMEVYGWTISETGMPGKGAQFSIDIPEAKPDRRQNYRLS